MSMRKTFCSVKPVPILLALACAAAFFTSCATDSGDAVSRNAQGLQLPQEKNPDLMDAGKRKAIAEEALAKIDSQFPGLGQVRTSPLNQLRIRDICILPNDDGLYYLVASGGVRTADGQFGRGFVTYVSEDLEQWRGPYPAFIPKEGTFWRIHDFWAPELHCWKGNYYIFGTTGDDSHRGTQIFRSTSGNPAGPYEPVTPRPVTPEDWMCLDGTLYVDEAGDPWMVFCHEWVQVTDGTICAARLSDDFTHLEGEPVLLFHGSDGPNNHPDPGKDNYVTDGAYLFREDGQLKMIWSGYDNGAYNLWLAVSESGKLQGPWKQIAKPLYTKDGGHGMHFVTFEGKHKIILHAPNRDSRAVLLDCDGKAVQP